MTRRKLICLDDEDLFSFFCSCPVYSVFHRTSLLLEAFNFVAYKIKSGKTVTPLGFSYLVISKTAETLVYVHSWEPLQTMETLVASFLVHFQGSDSSHKSPSEQTGEPGLKDNHPLSLVWKFCIRLLFCHGPPLRTGLRVIPDEINRTSKHTFPPLFCLKWVMKLKETSWTLDGLWAWEASS